MIKATARHILVKQNKLALKIKKEILNNTLTFEKAAKNIHAVLLKNPMEI